MSKFKEFWDNYPDEDPCHAKDREGKILFANQCAIRLSYALKKSGIRFETFPAKRKCWIHKSADHVLAAKELADWLEKTPIPGINRVEMITGEEWRTKIVGRTGIVCFEDYYTPSGGSGGDHIDLWDGSSMTGIGSWLRTRFSIVIPSLWSDLRKSKRIRFFPVS